MEAKWVKSYELAEVAEALGLNTNQIMGMSDRQDGLYVVYYTPDVEEKDIWQATLTRDKENIMRECEMRRELPGFMEKIQEMIDATLKDISMDDDAD